MIVLAGGCDRKYPDYWQRLSEVVLREVEQPVILSCLFSNEKERRAEKYKLFDNYFKQYFGDDASVLHAEEEMFYDQLASSNILYLHGGRTEMLLAAIKDVNRFRTAIRGKVVVGSSAGANYLSTTCYSPSAQRVLSGSGTVPVGVIVHYGIDQFEETMYTHEFWRSAARDVREQLGGEKPLLLLPEGQFVIVDNEDY